MKQDFAANIKVERTLFGAMVAWVIALFWWLFLGSGYAEIEPSEYMLSTTVLLTSTNTAGDAKELIERDGYISIMDQHRLVQRIILKK